jgi:hypothetical protein
VLDARDFAALARAKVDPLVKKLFSSLGQADQASAERGKLRTQLGAEFVRKLELK